MRGFPVLVLAFLLACPAALGQIFPPPIAPAQPSVGAPAPPSGPSAPLHSIPTRSLAALATFVPVDALAHQDDFWSNMLVGDANHNGREEVVIRYTPVTSGQNQIVFYEDDGTGHFDQVFQFDRDDRGVLALGDVDQDGLSDLFFEEAIGPCNHRFVRYEASSPSGFPDHEVWSARKEGNVVDMTAVIADVDGDGLLEFVTSDADFNCTPSQLKVFEARA